MSNQHGPEARRRSGSHVTLQAMRSHVQPGSFPLLLVASLLLYVLNGLAVDSPAYADTRVGVSCGVRRALRPEREWPTLWLGLLVA